MEGDVFVHIFASENQNNTNYKNKIMKKRNLTIALCTFFVLTVVYLVSVFAFEQKPKTSYMGKTTPKVINVDTVKNK